MTLLALVGDTHGDSLRAQAVGKFCQEFGITQVYQLGDHGTGPWGRRDGKMPFVRSVHKTCEAYGISWSYVRGNHDDEIVQERWRTNGQLDENGFHIATPIEKYGNVRLIPDGHVWSYGGRTFGALGGAVSIDRARRTEGVSWWATEFPNAEAAERLTKVDVLLTHDAPLLPHGESARYKVDQNSADSRAVIRRAYDLAQPRLGFHGHYHERYNGRYETTTVVGLGMNYDRFDDQVILLDTETLQFCSPSQWRRLHAAAEAEEVVFEIDDNF